MQNVKNHQLIICGLPDGARFTFFILHFTFLIRLHHEDQRVHYHQERG
jgi:hypothetical protein